MAVDLDWLATCQEAALEPGLPIVDAHHHLWDRPPQRPEQRYLLADYLADAQEGHRVVATVFVECNTGYLQDGPVHLRPSGETAWANAIAEEAAARRGARVAAAIVGWADFDRDPGEVDELLDAHAAAAPGRFRGIRQTFAWDADASLRYRHLATRQGMLRDAQWQRGFSRLARRGLSFDAWGYHAQLDDVAALARAFPDTPIVVDHLGGPLGAGAYASQAAAVREHWRAGLSVLATLPNVAVKLGGSAMHCIGMGWRHRATAPSSDEIVAAVGSDYRWVIDLFSPARCMFESNFPVDKEAVGAGVLWNAFKKLSSRYSPAERTALFAGTARRVYALGPG